jgi:hypothetical protein
VTGASASRTTAHGIGPWRDDLPDAERIGRLRAFAALCAVLCGSDHVVVDLLRRAEADPIASDHALAAFDRLPSLRRRHGLATYAAIMRPRSGRPP